MVPFFGHRSFLKSRSPSPQNLLAGFSGKIRIPGKKKTGKPKTMDGIVLLTSRSEAEVPKPPRPNWPPLDLGGGQRRAADLRHEIRVAPLRPEGSGKFLRKSPRRFARRPKKTTKKVSTCVEKKSRTSMDWHHGSGKCWCQIVSLPQIGGLDWWFGG